MLLCGVLALQIGAANAREPQQVQTDGARFVGSAGCKSSSCHGGAGEKRSQYITWARHDIHTRAYAILTDARSDRMADALHLPQRTEGISRAATSARCTICHSPFQAIPETRRAATADPTESVSCEHCHGAAGAWLRGHTRPDWTYATRVGAGMRDLKSIYVRANTCVGCHQNLDADVSAAGHPPLVFDLESQSDAEPRHWRDEQGTGIRAWLTGQAVALRELSWHLAMNANPNPQALVQYRALAWLLAKVTAAESTLVPIDPPTAEVSPSGFARTQQQADALARRAAQQNFSSNFAGRLTDTLAAADSDFTETADAPRDLLFLRAQRLVLAVEALAESTIGNQRPELLELRRQIRAEGEFDPAQFAARLAAYRASLSAAR